MHALVVEDDPIYLSILQESLRLRGHETTTFTDAEDALNACQAGVPPLVVTDWRLPGMDGVTLCRRLRALPGGANSVILMVTARDLPAEMEEALAGGIDDFLGKPFTPEALSVRLAVAEKNCERMASRAAVERKLHGVFHAARDVAFIITDAAADPKIIEFSPGAVRIFGCPRAEALGQPALGFLQPADLRRFKDARSAMERGEFGLNGELELVRRNGDRFPSILVTYPLQDDDGRMNAILAVAFDISALKEAQAGLLRSQQLAAVGTLAAGVAHEFNNTHGIILGFVDLVLRSDRLSNEHRRRLSAVREAALRAAGVTSNLLAFARQGPGLRRAANLNRIVETTLAIVQREFESEGIDIEVSGGEVPCFVMDERQVGQVLMNLLINARHALVERRVREIAIETGRRGDRAYLCVRDTGCGISDEHRTRLFDPFFTTKGEHAAPGSPAACLKGTGLGLSVCHTIVANHGGEIAVESMEGKGSVFTVWLPCTETGAPQVEELPLPDEHSQAARILVLDDEEHLQDLMRDMLQQAGHCVETTDDGRRALELLRQRDFDVVILDLQMPKMNGVEFLYALRNIELRRLPAVLVMTGKLTDENIEGYASLGVAGTLYKPFDVQTALGKIRAAMQLRS
jgi:PAS domain S-box-containing protein